MNENALHVDQYQRDLRWLFGSSPLMTTETFDFRREAEQGDWWTWLASHSTALVDFLQDKNLKMLGPYFEALWQFYLQHHPDKQLLAKNLQVFAQGTTLGEFDFIYRDCAANEFVHLEVAVKYYLGVESDSQSDGQSSLSDWWGPNVNDRLDRKVTRLAQHQSLLSLTSAGQAVLAELGIEQIRREVCLLGYLFYPFHRELAAPAMVNPQHLRGCWVYWRDLAHLLATTLERESTRWSLLDKPHWLAPVTQGLSQLSDEVELLSQLADRLSKDNRPQLIASFENDGTLPNYAKSRELIFVVPDSWPEIE